MTNRIPWTADTERAFLLALHATGRFAQAAVAIGRSPSSCNNRRHRVPAFAQACTDTLARVEAERVAQAGAARSPLTRSLNRTRHDGWTKTRQRAFCRALGQTGSYPEAAQAIGVSYNTVRRLRRQSPAFQAQCDQALVDGGLTVAEAAFVRAVEGRDEPVWHRGELVGHRPRFSESLLRALLQQEAVGMAPKRGPDRHHPRPPKTDDEVMASLSKKLDAMEKQTERRREDDREEWATRMKAKGWAP